jgi:hypothetical protein
MPEIHDNPKRYPAPDLRGEQNNRKNERWADGRLVRFPVSYRYNGGVTIDDEWYPGVEVPAPIVPEGYELVGIGVGLQLNARPPLATYLLRKQPSH